MIKAQYNSNTIELKGHSNYAPSGHDIVCSAITTAMLVTINLLSRLNDENSLVYQAVDGYIRLEILKQNNINQTIFENLIYTISDIASQYPKFVSINKQEVF